MAALDPHESVYLSDKDFRTKVIAVDFAVRAEYEWDAGIAIGRYLEGFKQGRILGRTCGSCRRTLVPPRMFCEQCFRPTDEWVEVRDTGIVNTFSLCYITWNMQRLEIPEIPAVIELDGASKGIGIMHKIGNVDPEAVRVGMKVRAVWKPPSQREGSVLDILYWEPTEPVRPRTTKSTATKSKRTKAKPTAKKSKAKAKASGIRAGRGR